MLYESPVLTVEEAAEYLKMSTDKMYILVQDPEFPAVKIGGRWKIVISELNVWLKKQCDDKHL